MTDTIESLTGDRRPDFEAFARDILDQWPVHDIEELDALTSTQSEG